MEKCEPKQSLPEDNQHRNDPITISHNLSDESRTRWIEQSHRQLTDTIFQAQSRSETPRFTDVFGYISNRYFYETLANVDDNIRLRHFYQDLRIGDRFIAKVINVFERSADVRLVWSERRDLADLRLQAVLWFTSNKSSRHGRSRYSVKDELSAKTLETSDRIYVEVVHIDRSGRKLEVKRCRALSKDDDQDEDDDEIIDLRKYRSYSPSKTSFSEYMLDHRQLRNPTLVMHPPFTSLLHSKQLAECLTRKTPKSIEQVPQVIEQPRNQQVNNHDSESTSKSEPKSVEASIQQRRPPEEELKRPRKRSRSRSRSTISLSSATSSDSSSDDDRHRHRKRSAKKKRKDSKKHSKKKKKHKKHHKKSKKKSREHSRSKSDDSINHKLLKLLKNV